MSSVLRPVGPKDPATYWKRRAIVLGGVLVTIVLVLALLSQCGAEEGTPSAGATPSATASGDPTASPTPEPTSSAEPAASPSASPSPSASQIQQPPACPDSAIAVQVQPSKQSYAANQNPSVTMIIANSSDSACSRDIGAAANEIKIESGGYHVWSSDDCAPDEKADVVTLEPGVQAKVTIEWNRTLSAPECSGGGGAAQPGTYQVVGRNLAVESPPATFALS